MLIVMNVFLKSDILTVTKILKKTKAQMWQDIKVGDSLFLYIPIKATNKGYKGRIYASYITIENITTGAETLISFNQADRYLKMFEFEFKPDLQ